MGANNGTGYPMFLRCAKCRRTNRDRHARIQGFSLRRFANEKPLPKAQQGNGNSRALQFLIKIKCLVCGHVGWTRHKDAQRLPIIDEPK